MLAESKPWPVDWSWWRKAPAEQELSDRIQKFFAAQGVDDYGPVYTLDGKPLLYGKKDKGFKNPPFIAWRRPPGSSS